MSAHGIRALPLVMSDHTVHLECVAGVPEFSRKSNWLDRLADQKDAAA